jgi:hypothetical protein
MRRTLLFAVVFFGLQSIAADGLLAQRTTTGTGGTQTNTGTAQPGGAQTPEQLGATGMIDSNARYLRENRQAGQMVGGEVAGVGLLRDQTGQRDRVRKSAARRAVSTWAASTTWVVSTNSAISTR